MTKLKAPLKNLNNLKSPIGFLKIASFFVLLFFASSRAHAQDVKANDLPKPFFKVGGTSSPTFFERKTCAEIEKEVQSNLEEARIAQKSEDEADAKDEKCKIGTFEAGWRSIKTVSAALGDFKFSEKLNPCEKKAQILRSSFRDEQANYILALKMRVLLYDALFMWDQPEGKKWFNVTSVTCTPAFVQNTLVPLAKKLKAREKIVQNGRTSGLSESDYNLVNRIVNSCQMLEPTEGTISTATDKLYADKTAAADRKICQNIIDQYNASLIKAAPRNTITTAASEKPVSAGDSCPTVDPSRCVYQETVNSSITGNPCKLDAWFFCQHEGGASQGTQTATRITDPNEGRTSDSGRSNKGSGRK